MRRTIAIAFAAALTLALAGCAEKKKSEDIITQRAVTKPTPAEPVRMAEYTDERDVAWIGRTYKVSIHRQPADSLPKVKDETGQTFVDNTFRLTVSRSDGSVFFTRTFQKSSVAQYLDDNYRRTGIFEGLVFDRADGDWLVFGASVGHPQTDEYIPLVIRLSRMGALEIRRDSQMDTSALEEDEV